jgi:iron-sulfur cluster repair protein YtfE (RIC family)
MLGLLFCLFAACLALNPYIDDPDIKDQLLTTGNFRDTSNWVVEGYFHPHEALRRDLFLANRTLQQSFDPLVPWHIKSFFAWFDFELTIIHGHHWAEETIIFPAIVASVPDMPMPPRMAKDHKALIQYLEDIGALKEKFVAAQGNPEQLKQLGQKLKSVWLALVTDMQEHFDEEENTLIPMIQRGFTQKSFGALVVKLLLDKFDPWNLLWELPPIVGWMPQWCVPKFSCPADSLEKFRARIPRPVWFLTDNIMGPRWEDALRTLQGIERGVEVPYSKYSLREHELTLLGGFVFILVVIYIIIRSFIRAARGSNSSSSSTNHMPPRVPTDKKNL